MAAHAEQPRALRRPPGADAHDRRRHRRSLSRPPPPRQPAGRMELSPATSLVRWTGAPRMIPSRYPVAGLLDRVASPADLDALFELEGWTNDRISNELGLLHTVPESEWRRGRRWAPGVLPR